MKLDPKLKDDIKRFLKERIKKDSEKVTLISSIKLNDEEKDLLFKKIPDLSKREIEEQIDPGILAGVVVKSGSKIFDASLLGQLNNLKRITYGATG